MPQVTITVRKNGSLRIDDPNGLVEMVDADGNRYDLTGKPAFSLCRCGASANRPFCDVVTRSPSRRPIRRAKPRSGPAFVTGDGASPVSTGECH